jgi:uncharacterized damage-inducible protein DinB
MNTRPDGSQVLAYNLGVLAQGLSLLAYAPLGFNYGAVMGSHLRHVIEHYQAFFTGLKTRSIAYDRRDRCLEIEQNPQAARVALQQLQAEIEAWSQQPPEDHPLTVWLCLPHGQEVMSFSTAQRELLFLASHATHHYALIKTALPELALPADFGKAPSTVCHERAQA